MFINLKYDAEGLAGGLNFDEFEPIGVTRQIVAGTIYWVKVRYNGDKYLHMNVFQALPHTG